MKVGTVGKKLTEVERAYIAGFLDADGAIMASIEKHAEKKFGFRIRVIFKITQSRRNVLDWFQRKTGLGSVVRNRTTFDWLIRNQESIKIFIPILLPYLQVKRQQANKAIHIINAPKNSKTEFLRAAQSADSLSGKNVRSKNRRKNFWIMVQDSFSRND